MTADHPRHRWFAFSLRTMFIVMTVVSISIGWPLSWVWQRRLVLRTGGVTAKVSTDPRVANFTLAPWPLRWFGEPGIEDISIWVQRERNEAESEEQRLHRLFPEAKVTIHLWSGPLTREK